MGWLQSDARSVHIYLVAAAIGLMAFVLVYGVGHLFGTTAYWQMPMVDERMSLMGYRYFLNDSWHWPVFTNDAVNVPYPKSVAFLDCIPVWALFNKALSAIVPPWKSFSADAYLGLWHGLTYALQACFGVACLRALGHRSWRTGIVTALFFIAVPTWIARYAHPALSAHWILLWAFYLYLRTPAGQASSTRLGVAKLCQLGVSALVSPYLATFSLLIFIPSVSRSRHWRTIAPWLPLGLLCVGLATWFGGYFAAEIEGRQWGFEWNSANALSWLIPPRSGIVGDAQWIANVNPTPYQYDGYAYLGIGILALLAVFLPHVRLLNGVIRRHPVLFVVIVGCSLFALSNHVYFGSHEILEYRIPRFFRFISNQFRSPGRFVWVPTYAVILFLLHWAYTRFATGRRFAIIAVAALLQVVDATGEWARQTATTSHRHAGLVLDAWRPLIHAHRAVMILPPYPCVLDEKREGLDAASWEIQFLASQRALPINGTYCAREQRRCAEEEQAWATLGFAPDTLYVVLRPALAVAERFEAAGGHCAVFHQGRVCSTNAAAIAAATQAKIVSPTPGPITLGHGEKLQVADAEHLSAGWAAPEPGGRWTTSSVASVLLHLDGEPPAGVSLKLQVRARLCGARTTQAVDVLLDDKKLATLQFDPVSNETTSVRTVAIPDRDHLRRSAVSIQFKPQDPRSRLGCAEGARPGVWLTGLWFE